MKILHVIRTLDPAWGGPVESIRQLGSALAERGHQVEVACLDAPGRSWLKTFPLPVHALGSALGVYGFGARWASWLRKNARGYDFVIMNGLWQYHSFGTWRILRKLGVPYGIFPHGALDPWFKRTYPLKHLKKWLYWPWAEYRVLRDANAVLFTCEEERILARQSFWMYQCREVVVNQGTSMPSGDAEAQKSAFYARFPELRGKRLLLFMGRIHPKKGCDLLIEAFAKVFRDQPEWRLVMAGPDSVGWQSKLASLARQRQIAGRITWAGMITEDIKYGALQAAEVFILPSHQENFGIAVAEALSCGLPTLIAKPVNIWREVEHDGAGIVAKDDLEGTCSLLRAWLAMADADRQLMRERAKECFRNRFEVGKAADCLLESIKDAIAPRESRADAVRNAGSAAKQLRILHVIRTLNPAWGGPVESIRQFGAAVTSCGHRVEVACLDAPDAPWLKNFPLPAHALGPALGVYGFGVRWAPWLRENLPNYDFVVMNGIWQYHSFGTWRVIRSLGIPYAIFSHGALDPWFKRTHPFKHLKKWMYWPWAEYRVLRDARAVLFTCEQERILARQSFGLYRCNELVVGYGTSTPVGDPAGQSEAFFVAFPELRGKRIALYVGRLHPRKGCDLVVDAFAKVLAADPQWQLVMAGPDQTGWRRTLQQNAAQAGIAGRVTWIDMLSGDAKWGAMRAAEFLFLPSHGENFSIVVAEALACGTPVLISDKINIWREVQSGNAGLVAADDLDGACDLLRNWLSMPQAMKQRMLQNTRECYRKNFEIGEAAQNLVALAASATASHETGIAKLGA
jgi:glycosyltransferase involved in cell wall biosynthesis